MGWRCSNSVQPSRRPLRVGLPVARMDGRRRQRSGGRELAEVMRACTTGSDYANQIGLETDEGSEHISEWAKRTQPEAPFSWEFDPKQLNRHRLIHGCMISLQEAGSIPCASSRDQGSIEDRPNTPPTGFRLARGRSPSSTY
jgi:hypothetical protein